MRFPQAQEVDMGEHGIALSIQEFTHESDVCVWAGYRQFQVTTAIERLESDAAPPASPTWTELFAMDSDEVAALKERWVRWYATARKVRIESAMAGKTFEASSAAGLRLVLTQIRDAGLRVPARLLA